MATVGRTESISIQVHPDEEQDQINLMQLFHWSLLNSQEIKSIDNHLERRGDDIYQITNVDHYVKLAFSRAIDLPNLEEVRGLEQRFFSLPHPDHPNLLLGGNFILTIFLFPFWVAYFFMSYRPNEEKATSLEADNDRKRQELLGELSQYN